MADETKTGMLEENPGQLSVMRVILVSIAGSTLGMFVISNLAMLVKFLFMGGKLDMVDIPANMMALTIAALGAKMGQRFGEK